MLDRMVFEYLFLHNPKLAWSVIDIQRVSILADILWKLPQEHVDFTVVAKSSFLQELYTAKGYIKDAQSSGVFELNILIHLQNKIDATLSFEYICKECKVVFPFGFHRCSSCHAIDSLELEYAVVKDYFRKADETSNSFL
jgi:hypothetical protein